MRTSHTAGIGRHPQPGHGSPCSPITSLLASAGAVLADGVGRDLPEVAARPARHAPARRRAPRGALAGRGQLFVDWRCRDGRASVGRALVHVRMAGMALAIVAEHAARVLVVADDEEQPRARSCRLLVLEGYEAATLPRRRGQAAVAAPMAASTR